MKVGVILPLVEYPQQQPSSYSEIRELALQAEEADFDSIWLFDHLLFRWGEGLPTNGTWECWTILAALAEVTKRVQLGTLVLCTAFRNPALLAKMAVTLDTISGGRLTLGLGAGWHKPEFDAFGVSFDKRVSRFEEALLRDYAALGVTDVICNPMPNNKQTLEALSQALHVYRSLTRETSR